MIRFEYDDEEAVTSVSITTHAVDVSITTHAVDIEAVIDTFERFLLAVGYELPEGAHIGFEYEEEKS